MASTTKKASLNLREIFQQILRKNPTFLTETLMDHTVPLRSWPTDQNLLERKKFSTRNHHQLSWMANSECLNLQWASIITNFWLVQYWNSVYVCVYIYIYVCVCVGMYIYIYIFIFIYWLIYIHVFTNCRSVFALRCLAPSAFETKVAYGFLPRSNWSPSSPPWPSCAFWLSEMWRRDPSSGDRWGVGSWNEMW